MASLKSLTLFFALCLILSSCLEMRKHSQQEDEKQEETKIPKDSKIKQTKAIGSSKGLQFDEWEQSLSQVTSITIKSGTWIDGIRIDYSNGKSSKPHGGFGDWDVGNRPWIVPSGEHIARVNIRAGNVIDQIQFITDKGSRSPKWGKDGGVAHSIGIPEGYKIVGLFGREGEFLDRIGFNIAPLQETENHNQI